MNMQDALEKFLLISWRKNISAYSKNFHIPKFLVVEEIKLFCYVHKILLLLIFYLKIPTLDTFSLKKKNQNVTKYSRTKEVQNFYIHYEIFYVSLFPFSKFRIQKRIQATKNSYKILFPFTFHFSKFPFSESSKKDPILG